MMIPTTNTPKKRGEKIWLLSRIAQFLIVCPTKFLKTSNGLQI